MKGSKEPKGPVDMLGRPLRLVRKQLRCPDCDSTRIDTRLRTKKRVCRRCGCVGEPEEFEVKAEPEKKKKKK